MPSRGQAHRDLGTAAFGTGTRCSEQRELLLNAIHLCKLLSDVLPDGLLCPSPDCLDEIGLGPEFSTPEVLTLEIGVELEEFTGADALDRAHDVGGTVTRKCLERHVNVVRRDFEFGHFHIVVVGSLANNPFQGRAVGLGEDGMPVFGNQTKW